MVWPRSGDDGGHRGTISGHTWSHLATPGHLLIEHYLVITLEHSTEQRNTVFGHFRVFTSRALVRCLLAFLEVAALARHSHFRGL